MKDGLPTFEQYLAEDVKVHKGEKGITKQQEAKIEKLLDQYGDISTQIDTIINKYQKMMEKELKTLPDKQDKLMSDIEKMVEKLNIQTAKSNNVVAKFKKAYQQHRTDYKKAWETALEKVNKQAKGVMESLLGDFAKTVDVKGKLTIVREGGSVETSEGFKDFVSSVKDKVKKGAKAFVGMVKKSIDKVKKALPKWGDAVSDLDKLTAQIG